MVRHWVQFFESEAGLLESVRAFLGDGLRAGGAAIAFATAEHGSALRELLALQVGEARGDQLVVLDAREMLATFLRDGIPDPDLFKSNVGSVIERAASESGHVYAYGEMVATLLADGNEAGALALEELWNRFEEAASFLSVHRAYSWNVATVGGELKAKIRGAGSSLIPDASIVDGRSLESLEVLSVLLASAPHYPQDSAFYHVVGSHFGLRVEEVDDGLRILESLGRARRTSDGSWSPVGSK